MSNPYTTVTVSGFNANPPSDDGARTAANQLSWSKHKTKLADPLKTAIEAINANLLTAFAKLFANDVSTHAANYTVTVADQGKMLLVSGTTTITLPAVASAQSNFAILVINSGSAAVTVAASSGELINGGAVVGLGPAEGVILASSGTAWSALVTRRFPNRLQTKTANYAVAATDDHSWLDVTATATIALPAAASAGASFRIGVINSSQAAVLVSTTETINGQGYLRLVAGAQALLACDGSKWRAIVSGGAEYALVKTADETVNNSDVLQDDNHLAGFIIDAAGYYRITGMLRLTTTVAADFKMALAFTAAPQEFAVTTPGGSTSTPGGAMTFVVAATEVFVYVDGYVKGHATADGTMTLQWAQGTADASDTILSEGSWLEVKKVA